MDFNERDLRNLFRQVLEQELGQRRPALARKWDGGTLVFKPGDVGRQDKEIPIEVFFKKLTAVRERLRLLEQKINNQAELSPTQRAEFQALLARAYGSLTTFNSFFAEEDDKFHGTGGEA